MSTDAGTRWHRAYTRPVGFDSELARALLEEVDRDTAAFFAGRRAEIQRFDEALRTVERRFEGNERALFLVYQGAPGCGKTSLVSHLRKARPEEIGLLVNVQPSDLASVSALTEQVRRTAEDAGPAGSRVAARFAQALASYLRMGGSGAELRSLMADRTARRAKVVLHLDEAQVIDESAKAGLLMLHTRGLGAPCVFLFTGLSHTAQRIDTVRGGSQAGENTVFNMGAMAAEECAESTAMMLAALGAGGGDAEKDRAAGLAAELSYGWPQHLHIAQTALCRELLRTDGTLRGIDSDRVRTESDRRRHDYYAKRLSGSVLGLRPSFTAAVVARVTALRPHDWLTLADLCEDELQQSGLAANPNFDATSGEFAAALVERGVLSITPDGRYDVAIPSMARWLAAGTR